MSTMTRPFGAVTTAMVTPFSEDGERVDLDAAQRLAKYLIERGNDGLVINGTTGESPTTSDDEKIALLQAVRDAVGADVPLLAGVGSNNTAHTLSLTERAIASGADGLLVVTPYYSKPSQAGLIAHTLRVADLAQQADKQVMLYDIPGRSGVALAPETIRELAQHPAITCVKDAKGNFQESGVLLHEGEITYYSGDDAANLPWLAMGAAGMVSVVAHVASPAYARMVAAFDAGDNAEAGRIHRALAPVVEAVMGKMPGAVAAKLALRHAGVLTNAAMRLPLVQASSDQERALIGVLTQHQEILS
ncbi:4-hydroxy-tetrahydrodipicolinate synthase [Dermabacteraceae bacterium CCM 9520]